MRDIHLIIVNQVEVKVFVSIIVQVKFYVCGNYFSLRAQLQNK